MGGRRISARGGLLSAQPDTLLPITRTEGGARGEACLPLLSAHPPPPELRLCAALFRVFVCSYVH